MATVDANKVEKIYLIKSEGSAAFIKELREINKLFDSIAASKRALLGQKSVVEDPVQLAKVNEELAAINAQEEQLVQRKATALQAAREEITANTELIGTYEQLKATISGINAGNGGALTADQSAAINAISTAQDRLAASSVTAANAQNQVSAAILAGRDIEAQRVEEILSEEEAQRMLNESYAETKAAVAEAAAITAEMRDAIATTTEAATEQEVEVLRLSERLVQLGEQASAVAAQMKLLTKQYEAGSISEQQYLSKGAELLDQQALIRAEMQLGNAELKNQAQLQIMNANSVAEWRTQVRLLSKERDAQNLLTQEGTVRQTELNVAIDEYNALIRQSVDAYTKQKINIGNYPNLTAELRAVRLEMEKLIVAGERDSVEFQKLSARAQELAASLAEVKAASQATAGASLTTAERIGMIADKATSLQTVATRLISSFTRMALHFIAFTVVIGTVTKAVEYFTDKIKNEEQGITEYDKELEKSIEILDRWNARKQKQIELIQKEIAERNGLISSQFNTQSNFEIKNMERQLELLKAQQETGKNALKDKDANLKLDQQVFDLEQKITQKRIQQVKDLETDISAKLIDAMGKREGSAIIEGIRTVQADLEQRRLDLENQVKINAANFKRQQDDKYNPYKTPKTPKDFAKEEYTGLKQLFEAVAKLRTDQAEREVQENQRIMQDDQQTLEARLQAYEKYAAAKRSQLETTRTKAISEAQAETVSVDKLLNDGNKKRTQEQTNSLLAQKAAAYAKLVDAEEQYQADISELNRQGDKERKAIAETDVQRRLTALTDIRAAEQADRDEDLRNNRERYKRHELTYREFKNNEQAITNVSAAAESEAVARYLQEQIESLKGHDAVTVKLRKVLNETLNELYKQDGKNFDDAEAIKEQVRKARLKLYEDAALQASQTLADGYVSQRQREMDKDQAAAEQQLNNQREVALSHAQSTAEREAIEAEFAQKSEALRKKQFEQNKKLSETQLALDFAVATGRAAASAVGTGPAWWLDFATKEAAVALEYAAKLAVIEAQQYAMGGDIPSRGGRFGGKRHSQGGTRFYFGDRWHEAEVDELAIISRNSAQKRDRLTVSGTPKQIASAVNAHGGGVNFAPGATIGRFDYGGSLGTRLRAPVFSPVSSGPGNGSNEAMMAVIQQAIAAFGGVNNRVDNIVVKLDPNAVSRSMDDQQKYVQVSTL